jgi:predicted nucleic acid-binding protein
MPNLTVPATGCWSTSPPHGPDTRRVPALFDTGALELLRRRHGRVEILASKHYPPVVCPHVVSEYLFGQFQARVSEAALVAARVFVAPFEVLATSARTPDLCAQLQAQLQESGATVTDAVSWIAAHAIEHGLPVVTTDATFRRVPGLKVHLVHLPWAEGQEKRRPALAGRL